MAIKEKQMETLLAALAEKIESQEITILVKDYEIEKLKKQLAEAEKIIAEKANKEQEKTK